MRDVVASLLLTLSCLEIVDYAREKHGLLISERTFHALDNNKKAFEVISYALLSLLDPAGAHDKLDRFFPCKDGVRGKEYRQAVFAWLTALKKEHALGDSVLRRSILDDAAGERYEDLLFHLASHVFLHLAKRDTRPSLLQRLALTGTDEELLVADLASSQRLARLRERRKRVVADYTDFSAAVASRADPEAVEVADIDASAERDRIKLELRRLKNVNPTGTAAALLAPPPPDTDPFFDHLPWQKLPSTARRSGSAVYTGQRPQHCLEASRARLASLTVGAHHKTATSAALDTDRAARTRKAVLPPIEAPALHITIRRTAWRDRVMQTSTSISTNAVTSSNEQAPPATDIAIDLGRLRQSTPRRQTAASVSPVKTAAVVRGKTSLRQALLQKSARKRLDGGAGAAQLKMRNLELSTPRKQIYHPDPTTPAYDMRRDRSDRLELSATAKSVNRLVDLLGRDDSVSEFPSTARSRSPMSTPTARRGHALQPSFSIFDRD